MTGEICAGLTTITMLDRKAYTVVGEMRTLIGPSRLILATMVLDADISPEDIDILSPQRVRTRDATTGHLVARSVRPTDDFSLPPSALPDLEAEDAHYILRNKLVEHLHYKWLNRELSWTK